MRCSQIGKAGEGIPAIHFQQVSLHHAWRELLAQARLKPHLHINGVLLDSTGGTDHPKVKKHKVWFMQALKESLSSSLSTSSSRPSHLRTASRTTPLSASKSVEAPLQGIIICPHCCQKNFAVFPVAAGNIPTQEVSRGRIDDGKRHLVQASMPLQCQSMLSCFCYMMAHTPLSPRLTMSGAVERSAACGAITDISV